MGFNVAKIGMIFLLFAVNIHCDEDSHKYEDGEDVLLWMNTVGPYHNRQETYEYFRLPFCKGSKESKIDRHHENLGDALQGVELKYSGLDIKFKENVKMIKYCTVDLDKKKYETFIYAVKNHYWYQMYMDDLPIWGIVGEIGEAGKDEYFMWTHKKLEIGYNGDQIVDINLTSDHKVKLAPNIKIEFTYEVVWTPSDVDFKDRYEKYLDPSFFQHRIHWFSIFNSFMMVIFLVGLVSMILMRTLRKDYARYSKEDDLDDMERDLGDEYGWKQIHGDVFRPASYPILLCGLIGSGVHALSSAFAVVVFIIGGDLYTERGTVVSTGIFVYAALAPINGYVSGALYSRMGGRKWIRQMTFSALLLPALVCGTAFFINFIAMYYHASRAIPFGTMSVVLVTSRVMVVESSPRTDITPYLSPLVLTSDRSYMAMACIIIFVIMPLSLVGTILGRNMSGAPNHPCRINAVPRPIPEKRWFMEPPVIAALGGILPFGSIFIEMYFIFTSFWAYKIYYVYGFTLLVLAILAVVTVCVTIVCTYFLLNAEDYRWQWTSFSAASSTAVYVYVYSFYYFFFKTKMYGLFQTVYYFGYMAVFSIALGMMCGLSRIEAYNDISLPLGSLGYLGTSLFVRKIYMYVKID